MTTLSPRPKLIDRFGRHVNYVRISVTDRCDFRCVYCMAEDMTFLPRAKVLTLEELAMLGQAFSELGVVKIRLTGGEPLIRNNVMWLFRQLGSLPDLQELVLTTNASQLSRYAEELRAAGVKRINISLDTLDPQRFQRITRVGKLDKVISGIRAARAAGFERIKLNAVILKNRNHDEVVDLTRFAIDNELDISYIEEMPLGLIGDHDRAEAYYSSDQIRSDLEQHFELLPVIDGVSSRQNTDDGVSSRQNTDDGVSSRQNTDDGVSPRQNTEANTAGPSKYFRIPGVKSKIGFISPHSHNFCGDCNRVRVTVEGQLLLCLGQEHSVDLKKVLRSYPGDMDKLKQTIVQAMAIKPQGHDFNLQEKPVIFRHMSVTGG